MRPTFDPDAFDTWQRPAGIFVVIDVRGDAGERIHEIQRRFDPKLANTNPPHITLIGSSGVGPILPGTTREEITERLGPIAVDTEPFEMTFAPPVRFMQTNIVVLPLDPHGLLRTLHERIVKSGLRFQRARFSFTPHATLSFFRTLGREELREMLKTRIAEPVRIDHLRLSLTDDPMPAQTLMEIPLGVGG